MTNRRPSVPVPPKPIEPENEVFKAGGSDHFFYVLTGGVCLGVVLMAALFMTLHQCQ